MVKTDYIELGIGSSILKNIKKILINDSLSPTFRKLLLILLLISKDDIKRLMRLYSCGQLELRELITDVYSLDDINHAIDRMNSGEIRGRSMIKF